MYFRLLREDTLSEETNTNKTKATAQQFSTTLINLSLLLFFSLICPNHVIVMAFWTLLIFPLISLCPV